jgi:hypothetical protein
MKPDVFPSPAGHSLVRARPAAGVEECCRRGRIPNPFVSPGCFTASTERVISATRRFPIESRHVIRDLIGEEAEFLAYVFCVTDRPTAFLLHAGSP